MECPHLAQSVQFDGNDVEANCTKDLPFICAGRTPCLFFFQQLKRYLKRSKPGLHEILSSPIGVIFCTIRFSLEPDLDLSFTSVVSHLLFSHFFCVLYPLFSVSLFFFFLPCSFSSSFSLYLSWPRSRPFLSRPWAVVTDKMKRAISLFLFKDTNACFLFIKRERIPRWRV